MSAWFIVELTSEHVEWEFPPPVLVPPFSVNIVHNALEVSIIPNDLLGVSLMTQADQSIILTPPTIHATILDYNALVNITQRANDSVDVSPYSAEVNIAERPNLSVDI